MLILLTNYYPYFRGEEYIESEINFLSDQFDEILVIPSLISKNMVQTRQVPDNVKILPATYENTKFSKATSMLKSLLFMNKEKRKIIKNDSQGKFINKLYDYYFEGRTKSSYEQIIKKLENHNIDKDRPVVLYSYWFHATAKIAVELKRNYFKNVTYILSRGHAYDVIEDVSAIKFLPYRNYLLDNIDNLFLVSSTKANSMRRQYPKYKNKIDYARLGTEKINDKPIEKNKKFILVSCSGIREIKKVDKIVNALAYLDKKNFNIEWFHFGTGPLMDNIKKLANDNLNNIKYNFMGHIDNKDLLNWYKNNGPKAFVNTSISEGVPVSIMEAMSLGIPTIATNAGGTGELVKDNINGYLLDVDANPKEIAYAIEKLYNLDEDEYSILENNAYKTWNDDFNSFKNYTLFSKMIKGKLEDNYDGNK